MPFRLSGTISAVPDDRWNPAILTVLKGLEEPFGRRASERYLVIQHNLDQTGVIKERSQTRLSHGANGMNCARPRRKCCFFSWKSMRHELRHDPKIPVHIDGDGQTGLVLLRSILRNGGPALKPRRSIPCSDVSDSRGYHMGPAFPSINARWPTGSA